MVALPRQSVMGTQATAGAAAADLPEDFAQRLRALSPMILAFSGGLDSRFLSFAALRAGCDVLAVHAQGPHILPEESREATAWAMRRGLPLIVLTYDPLTLPAVAAGSRERCYACKQGLLAAVCALPEMQGRTVCDGSNADDLHAFRPGLRALAEAGVRSPLAEAGLSKALIRARAAALGLDRPEQRARPCLLTRFAYDVAPDAATLLRLAACEVELAQLFSLDAAEMTGAEAATDAIAVTDAMAATDILENVAMPHDVFVLAQQADPVQQGILGDFRLRLTPSPLLQAEHLPETAVAAVQAILQRHGFSPCALQQSGAVSGFFDAAASSDGKGVAGDFG